MNNLIIRNYRVVLLRCCGYICKDKDKLCKVFSVGGLNQFTKKIFLFIWIFIFSTLGRVGLVSSVNYSTKLENMRGQGDEKNIIGYEELLADQKNDKVLIIDVREQKEIDETGKLPGSIHIPMGNVTQMLNLTDEEFKNQFNKLKPDKDTKIVLSCRSGMRSANVQQELLKLGYENAYNYIGGWSEWETKQKS
ncbi:Similar to Tstd3: Thiosulfate sulfurtransferase/rhodanese-like domain-containing protein 3 (Mus musculus) [Cotesia congregata]|uniref:Similar to Tstd3: Thiosulfate sulfurtransferase/rhodanese-like domain-containing protein 3 (Mus musculus) n=1 Tax=Cotesia congregata TaxID=51543 RepID=A0A8J2HR22_COTCN|nr:Similar to Tstd3: Thiosulfate sulfurtransferase/rhodanese-like domain-containing protein 3 (Mus musculus) [Cotesia congregata]